MEKNDFVIKGFKSFNTHNGYAFECSLYVKEKRVAVVTNGGYGGENEYQIIDKDLFKEFSDFVKTIPDKQCPEFDFNLKYDNDLFAEDLIEKYETDKFFRKNCKKKIVIVLPNHKENECLIIDYLYTPKTKELVLKKYPKAIFMNEIYS